MSEEGKRNSMAAIGIALNEIEENKETIKEMVKDGHVTRYEGITMLGMFLRMLLRGALSILTTRAK